MAAIDSVYDVPEVADAPMLDEKDELDSLPSISTSEIYSDEDSDAQEEWERSLQQLQMLLTMMVVPLVGKYFGRKFAYWSAFGPFGHDYEAIY